MNETEMLALGEALADLLELGTPPSCAYCLLVRHGRPKSGAYLNCDREVHIRRPGKAGTIIDQLPVLGPGGTNGYATGSGSWI